MKKMLSFALFPVVICIFFFTLWHSDTAEARYQYYDQWYAPTFKIQGKVDAVMIGRSGMQTAFNSEKFSKAMSAELGRPYHAVDLSKSWSGTDTQYIQARDILQNTEVDVLLVQIYPDAAREHEMFYQLATYGDIFEGSFAYEEMNLVDQWQRALSLSLKKWAQHLTLLTSSQWKKLPSGSIDLMDYDPTPSAQSQNYEAQQSWIAEVGDQWREKSCDLWPIDAAYDARNRHFYKKIVKLAKDHNTRLAFVFFPELYNAPMTEQFVVQLQSEYGPVDILSPKVQDLEWMYPSAYADHGHANEDGQDFAMRMYARQLFDVLEGKTLEFSQCRTMDEEPQNASLPGVEFAEVLNGELVEGNVTWLFEGKAQSGKLAGKTVLSLSDPKGLIRLYPDAVVKAGDTVTVRGRIERLGGNKDTNIRVLLSRDCSTNAEDYGQILESWAPDEMREFSVSHKFQSSHGCLKLILNALDATPQNPLNLSIQGLEMVR